MVRAQNLDAVEYSLGVLLLFKLSRNLFESKSEGKNVLRIYNFSNKIQFSEILNGNATLDKFPVHQIKITFER